MTADERAKFFIGYLGRFRTQIDRAKAVMRLAERLFDEGTCPHCSARLLGIRNADLVCWPPRSRYAKETTDGD